MLPDDEENLGLQNHVKATPEQAEDLLGFRSIGQREFEAYISYRILRIPRTETPNRRKRLNTFSATKATQKKLKQIEGERKIQ